MENLFSIGFGALLFLIALGALLRPSSPPPPPTYVLLAPAPPAEQGSGVGILLAMLFCVLLALAIFQI